MHAFSEQCLRIGCECRYQCLSFSGSHFGDLSLTQGNSPDQLDVKVPLIAHALAGFANQGKSLGDDILEGCAFGNALLEFCRFLWEICVSQSRHFRFELVDLLYDRLHVLEEPRTVVTKHLVKPIFHRVVL